MNDAAGRRAVGNRGSPFFVDESEKTVSTSEVKVSSRDELERQLWMITEWRGSADVIDHLLLMIDDYAASKYGSTEGTQVAVEDTHTPARDCDLPYVTDLSATVVEEPESLAQVQQEELTSKRCKLCLEMLPIGEFHRDRSMKDGYRSKCKACLKR